MCQSSVWPRLAAWSEQLKELTEAIRAANDGGDHPAVFRLGVAATGIKRLIQEYRRGRLLDLLSFEHWLPNFAFPQDTTQLRVVAAGQAGDLRLERPRSRAIAEYAPGAEVIVNGKSITAAGLDLLKREPDLRRMHLDKDRQLIEDRGTLPRGGRRGRDEKLVFAPDGFVTAYGQEPKEPNVFREPPQRVTPVYLVRGSEPHEFAPLDALPRVHTAVKTDARVVRLNLAGACGATASGSA